MNKWKELSSKQIAALYERRFPAYSSRLGVGDPVWQARFFRLDFRPLRLLADTRFRGGKPVKV